MTWPRRCLWAAVAICAGGAGLLFYMIYGGGAASVTGVRLLSAGSGRGDAPVESGGPKAPPAVEAWPSPAGRETALRVLTFNIRHGATDDGRIDLPAVAAAIRASGADVVAVQEVDRFQLRSGLTDEARWLAEELGMEYAFGPAMRRGLGQYGNLLLSRYPILAWRNMALPGELEPRSAIIARLATPGGEVTVAATHFGLSQRDRANQAGALVEEVSREPLPRILLGDWDAAPDAAELARVAADYVNALAAAGVYPANTFRAGQSEPYASLDHIFVSPDVAVQGAQVMPQRVSDHQPVLAELLLPPPRRG